MLQAHEADAFLIVRAPVVSQNVQFPIGYSESVHDEQPSGQLKADIE
jgi:hypothetical protein